MCTLESCRSFEVYWRYGLIIDGLGSNLPEGSFFRPRSLQATNTFPGNDVSLVHEEATHTPFSPLDIPDNTARL